jgi:hypothetical protein
MIDTAPYEDDLSVLNSPMYLISRDINNEKEEDIDLVSLKRFSIAQKGKGLNNRLLNQSRSGRVKITKYNNHYTLCKNQHK